MRDIVIKLQRIVRENLHRLITILALLGLFAVACGSGATSESAAVPAVEPTAVVNEATAAPEPEPTSEPLPAPTSTPVTVEEADVEPTAEPTADIAQDTEPPLFDLALLGAAADLELAVVDDPAPEDTFGEIGGTGIAAPASTLVGSQAFIATMTSEQVDARFNNSSFPCGAATDFTVTCATGATKIDDTEFIIVGVAFEGPVAVGEGAHRYALALDDDGDESDNYTSEQFPGDWLTNTEVWYSLNIAADGTRTMWAAGVVDQVPGVPRFSTALVIEHGNRLYWVIPRSEVPGSELAYRATGFTELGAAGDEFNSATSGGDFTGTSVLDPLISIDLTPIKLDNDAMVPPQIEGSEPRLPIPADRSVHMINVLVTDFVDRANSVLGAGDAELAIDAILHPQQLFSPNVEACRQILRDTITQANSVELPDLPAGPTPGVPLAAYQPTGSLNYPTGSVAWQPFLVIGPDGRLFLLIPQCL